MKRIPVVKSIIFAVFSLLLLAYMVWPANVTINDFPALPHSSRSQEPGDTYQVPNVKAYYSLNFRSFVVPYYKTSFQSLEKLPFKPVELNYPPEEAFTWIKDQTQSTYLEQFIYPLRDSVYVNGFEPFYENGKPKFINTTDMVVDGYFYKTKTILRYYPSKTATRVLVWFGINLALIGLYYQTKRVFNA